MSEEVRGASVNVARSMVLSVFLNGILAFGMLLAVLFCAGDISTLLGASGYPFITIFANGVRSRAGATAMASLPLVLSGLAAIGNLAAASRMMWAFARDEGFPGWRSLSRVRNSQYFNVAIFFAFRRDSTKAKRNRSIAVRQFLIGPSLPFLSYPHSSVSSTLVPLLS